MTKLTEEQVISLIKEEYFVLLKFYEDFDARLLTIKGWNTTVGVAALALGIQNSKPSLFIFGSGVAFLFWVLEAVWKGLQHAYRPRISEIEEAFRNDTAGKLVPLQAHSKWSTEWKNAAKLGLKNCYRPIVCLPHAITMVAGAALAIASHYCML